MRRQAWTLLVTAVLAIALIFVGMGLPAPYVRLVPGPVTDTLGDSGGKPLITIKGHATAETTGRLYLVTVGEYGGPGQNLSAADVFEGWWRKSDAVVPVSLLFPPTETASQANQQDTEDMDLSQENAKIAALRYLGYDLPPGGVYVSSISSASPAWGKLKLSDVIVGVDSTAVTDADQLKSVLDGYKVGDQVTLDVQRDGKQVQVPVTLQPPTSGTTPMIGIGVTDHFTLPFEIDINLTNVGGPSAGMAFALGIIDKLSGGNLTGGRTIAGTGEIEADGTVDPIGGVQQKMAAARKAGATVFLVPKDNCAEALTNVPSGLRLVKVTKLSDAVGSIKKIVAGQSGVPSCSAS